MLDSTPVYFDVTEEHSSEEGGVTVIEVTKPNMAQKGIIKVSKTGEVFSSVTENEGVYQPVYELSLIHIYRSPGKPFQPGKFFAGGIRGCLLYTSCLPVRWPAMP